MVLTCQSVTLEIAGSIPVKTAIFAPIAQLDRASGYGPEGYGFESCLARHSVRDLAQLGRALGLGPRCRRFESYNPDHLNAGIV